MTDQKDSGARDVRRVLLGIFTLVASGISVRGAHPGRFKERLFRLINDLRASMIPASWDGSRQMGCNPLVMSLRCLLVDDNLRFLEAARVLLDRQGLDVVGLASTGAEAIRLTQELRPDVALVDIDLGNESGFDVVRLISERGDLAPSGLILISTHSEDDFADLIGQSPAVGFLSKSELSAVAVEDLLKEQRGGRSPRS